MSIEPGAGRTRLAVLVDVKRAVFRHLVAHQCLARLARVSAVVSNANARRQRRPVDVAIELPVHGVGFLRGDDVNFPATGAPVGIAALDVAENGADLAYQGHAAAKRALASLMRATVSAASVLP